jgi:F420-0:gamma-glutamyl ligase
MDLLVEELVQLAQIVAGGNAAGTPTAVTEELSAPALFQKKI